MPLDQIISNQLLMQVCVIVMGFMSFINTTVNLLINIYIKSHSLSKKSQSWDIRPQAPLVYFLYLRVGDEEKKTEVSSLIVVEI